MAKKKKVEIEENEIKEENIKVEERNKYHEENKEEVKEEISEQIKEEPKEMPIEDKKLKRRIERMENWNRLTRQEKILLERAKNQKKGE